MKNLQFWALSLGVMGYCKWKGDVFGAVAVVRTGADMCSASGAENIRFFPFKWAFLPLFDSFAIYTLTN